MHVHAAPAVVQEVPLPLCIHPCGATWLKLKMKAVRVGGEFDNRGAFKAQKVQRRRHPSMYRPNLNFASKPSVGVGS